MAQPANRRLVTEATLNEETTKDRLRLGTLEKTTVPQALADAKSYADTEISKDRKRLGTLEDDQWVKAAPIPAGSDANTLTTPGLYGAASASITNMPDTGVWAVKVEPTPSGPVQTWTSWNVPGKEYKRTKQGATWTPYMKTPTATELSAATWLKSVIAPGTDMDTVITPGQYQAGSASITNMPEVGVWAVTLEPTASGVIQTIKSWNVPGKEFSRSKQGSAWTGWVKATTGSDISGAVASAKTYTDQQIANIPSAAVTADVGIHQHEMRLSSLRGRVGAPRMGGKGAVTLICDHGTNNFASIVLPALRAAGLRCTLALNSQMYDPSYTNAASESATNWAQIKGWHDADGIEIANHGRTHQDATGPAAIRLEIEGGRKELEANLPNVPIDTFVQIGTPGDGSKWDGFNDGSAPDRYWETYAGRIILDSHALATGQVQRGPNLSRVYPLDGHPKQGASGYWLDEGQTGIDAAKARVDEAAENGTGVILRLHPRAIGLNGQITSAQLLSFITYLKGRKDAGEIEVLPYREWSLAVEW